MNTPDSPTSPASPDAPHQDAAGDRLPVPAAHGYVVKTALTEADLDQVLGLITRWGPGGYRHAATKASGLGKVFPWVVSHVLKFPPARWLTSWWTRRALTKDGVHVYLDQLENPQALLVVHRDGAEWTVTDHLRAQPGDASHAGRRLRDAVANALLTEANYSEATIRTATRSAELARAYQQTLPGLQIDPRRWWWPSIHLIRRPGGLPAAAANMAQLMKKTRNLTWGIGGAFTLVAALVVVNVLTAGGMMPAREGWDAAIANDPRSYITFGLLALPPLVSLIQLAQIRRALQLVPTIGRSGWDAATEPIRLVGWAWAIFVGVGAVLGGIMPVFNPELAHHISSILWDTEVTTTLIEVIGLASLAALLIPGRDAIRALFNEQD